MTIKTLNIAMVCDPITDFTAGGTVSTLRFAELLRQRGHKVIFLAANSPNQKYANSYNGFTIYRFRSVVLPKNEGQFRMSFPTQRQIASILTIEKIDIVHFMLPHPAAMASLRAARAVGARVVAHSHTQPENINFRPSVAHSTSMLGTVVYRYLAWLYKQADAVIFPSEFARRLFERRLDATTTTVISNGVDIRKYRPIARTKITPNNTATPKLQQPLTLLFVGRLHPEKAIDILIRAIPLTAQHYPEIHLSIVGRGYLDKKLRKLTLSLRMEERVTFHGTITEEELISAYNACTLFVLPSWAELEGMALLEAMACGKPIVVADSPHSASPFFVNDNGLLFTPGDPEDLANKLTILLADAPLREKMGRVSRIRSKNYDIQSSTDKLEELYWSLLDQNRSTDCAHKCK